MKYHGGFSIMESYNLPVTIRNWMYRRLAKQIEEENKQVEKASRVSNQPKK